MTEIIEYTLILKSVYSVAYGAQGLAIGNADIVYDVHQLFRSIAAIHGVTKCKLEVIGVVLEAAGTVAASPATAIDFRLNCAGFINTQVSDGLNLPILCTTCVNISTFDLSSHFLTSTSPLYINNINNISNFEILVYDSLRNTLNNNANCPAYSITFKIVPIFNS